MKVLVIGQFHHKNTTGLRMILDHLGYEYKLSGTPADIKNYDVIYCPTYPINTTDYPGKKFIFGPHFSVFPRDNIKQIAGHIYIQPSPWACDAWKAVDQIVRLTPFPFPVDIDKFSPIKQSTERDKVFVYYKRRRPSELQFLKDFLKTKGIEYRIFDYVARYKEEAYLQYLQCAKYGIVLDAHESQGFALEEALACGVPLLVWDATDMSQEHGNTYPKIPCTTVPYWDERCGHKFTVDHELAQAYDTFMKNIDNYQPRDYIVETLSTPVCADRFKSIVHCIF